MTSCPLPSNLPFSLIETHAHKLPIPISSLRECSCLKKSLCCGIGKPSNGNGVWTSEFGKAQWEGPFTTLYRSRNQMLYQKMAGKSLSGRTQKYDRQTPRGLWCSTRLENSHRICMNLFSLRLHCGCFVVKANLSVLNRKKATQNCWRWEVTKWGLEPKGCGDSILPPASPAGWCAMRCRNAWMLHIPWKEDWVHLFFPFFFLTCR